MYIVSVMTHRFEGEGPNFYLTNADNISPNLGSVLSKLCFSITLLKGTVLPTENSILPSLPSDANKYSMPPSVYMQF